MAGLTGGLDVQSGWPGAVTVIQHPLATQETMAVAKGFVIGWCSVSVRPGRSLAACRRMVAYMAMVLSRTRKLAPPKNPSESAEVSIAVTIMGGAPAESRRATYSRPFPSVTLA